MEKNVKQEEGRIRQFLSKVRTRLGIHAVLKKSICCLSVGMVFAALTGFLACVFPLYYAVHIQLGILGISLLVGLIWSLAAYPDIKQAARAVDNLGYQERFATAVEMFGESGFFPERQRADTMQKIPGIDIRHGIRFSISWKWLTLLVTSMVCAVFLAVLPTPAKKEADLAHKLAKAVEDKVDDTKKLKKELEKLAKDSDLSEADIKKLSKILSDSMEELSKSEDEKEIAKAEKRMEKKLKEAAKEMGGEENKELMDALAKALGDKNLAGQAEFLNKLSEMAEKSSAIAQNQEMLANLSEYLSEKELEQLAKAMEDALENGELTEKQLAQILENMDNVDAVAASGKLSEQMLANASTASGQNNASPGDGDQNNGNQSEGNPGDGNGSPGNGNGQGDGKGNPGGGQGEGQGNGQGGGGLGGGMNRGSNKGIEKEGVVGDKKEQVYVGNTGDDENLTGKHSGNNSYTTKSDQSMAWSGNRVDYNSVVGSYKSKANSRIQSGSVPYGMEDAVKSYFSELE